MTDTESTLRVTTDDGAHLAVKRKPNPGGTPAIFLHGLASNADLWNLPDVAGEDYRYRSLAALLHEAGYDIWLVNLRGHGGPRMCSEPPPDQDDWCLDHFILYDLPAVTAHVRGQAQRKPFIIGASMGSMTLAGYLQGARLAGQGDGRRIVADRGLARRRQAELAGCVLAEFPAALRWPESAYDAEGRLDWQALLRDWWRNDSGANYPFEVLSRLGWLQALVAAVGEVPLSWLAGDPDSGPWYGRLPKALGERVERMEKLAVEKLLQVAGMFTGGTNHRAEVIIKGRRQVLSHMKAGVLQQLAKCVRSRAFVSHLGAREHVYSDHYGFVELPTLVVQGGRDRIANADITRTAFFDVIPARDKRFLFYEEIAHGELEAAPVASERVYPQVVAWLDAHR